MAEHERHPEDLLPGLAEFVELLTEPAAETSEHLSVEEMTIEMPVELQLDHRDGRLALRASAPTQQVATTILPVWHTMRMTIRAVPHD